MRATSDEHFTLDRPTPVLEDERLEKVRVRHWFFFIARKSIDGTVDHKNRLLWEEHFLGPDKNAAEVKLVKHLQQWLRHDSQLSKLREDQLRFGAGVASAKYEEGATSPNESTLALFETLIRGSRAEYEFGHFGEPLWIVLAGKVSACEEYVAQCFTEEEMLNTEFRDRVQSVMDALIAPAYRIAISDIPELGVQQKSAHPVWLSHVNEVTKLPNQEPSAETLEVSTIDDQIILAIALWHIAAHRKEKAFLQLEWLLMGLCYGTIAHHFSEDIQTSVLEMLREKGSKIPLPRLGRMLSFEERWTTTFWK